MPQFHPTRLLDPQPVAMTGAPEPEGNIREMPGAPAPTEPPPITLKIDGETKTFTIADLQKEIAGKDRLQEAADRNKALDAREAELASKERTQADKMRLADKLAAFKEGGPNAEAAFREVATTVFGVTDEQVGALLQQHAGGPTEPDPTGAPAGTLLERKHLPPSAQAVDAAFAKVCVESGCTPDEFLGHLSGLLDSAGNQAGTTKIDVLIDQDPVLKVYLSARNDPDGATRKGVQAEILRRVTRAVPFERTAQEVLAEKKAWIQHTARVGGPTTRLPGLGPASQPGASTLQPTERPSYRPGTPIEKYVELVHNWRQAQASD